MSGRDRLSPMEFGKRIVAGLSILIAGVALAIICMDTARATGAPRQTQWMILFVVLVLMTVGAAITSWAESGLVRGIGNEVWPDDELRSLRSWFDRPLMTWGVWAPTVGGLIYIVASQHWHWFVMFSCLFAPVLVVGRVQERLRPPATRLEHLVAKPLQSGHWGRAE
jgi:MFS family permease